PGAAAGIEHPPPAQVRRQPGQQGLAHGLAPGPDRGADLRDRRVRGQPRPGLDGGAVEVGGELGAALGVAGRGHVVRLNRSRGIRRGRGPSSGARRAAGRRPRDGRRAACTRRSRQ
ncbi:hypothetical protein QU39_00135, partial [Staphylococcus aureus]